MFCFLNILIRFPTSVFSFWSSYKIRYWTSYEPLILLSSPLTWRAPQPFLPKLHWIWNFCFWDFIPETLSPTSPFFLHTSFLLLIRLHLSEVANFHFLKAFLFPIVYFLLVSFFSVVSLSFTLEALRCLTIPRCVHYVFNRLTRKITSSDYKLCVFKLGFSTGRGQLAFLLRSSNIRAFLVIFLEWFNFPRKDPSMPPGVSSIEARSLEPSRGQRLTILMFSVTTFV